jgi:hypothetical protein
MTALLLCQLPVASCGQPVTGNRQPLSGSVQSTESLGESTWGNERETLTILADGARFDGLCLAGVVPEKIAVDEAGTFSARGTLRQLGGARRDENAPREVVYRGAIRGDSMTLTIEGMDRVELVKSTLKKGVRGTAHPCA